MLKMRTRMIDVKENMIGTHIKFHCEACHLEGIKTKETQKHVYKCKHFNTKVFGSKISKMKKVVKRMKERTTKCKPTNYNSILHLPTHSKKIFIFK